MNSKDKTNPLWGGRFKDKADESALKFSASVGLDLSLIHI